MENKTSKPVRKPNRLPYYDYSKCGSYFVTICTADHDTILSSIQNTDVPFQPKVELTKLGLAVKQTLESRKMPGIVLEKYVIMPNHIHLLICIEDGQRDARKSVSAYVGSIKSAAANRWLAVCKAEGRCMGKVWQRSFHDHVVRNQQDYDRIWLYMEANPARWNDDCFYQ